MKILVFAPDQLKTRVGGLRTQVERTTEELINLGVEVDFFDPWKVYDFSQYDLCHIFSMNTPTYFKALLIPDSVPIVYSSVMWRTGSRLKIRAFVELFMKLPKMFLNDVICCRKLSEMAKIILPNTTHEIQWLAEATGVDKNKCRFVPNGADDHFENKTLKELESQSSIKIEKDYVFCSSVISTRKNLEKLAQACFNNKYPLVIAGPIVDKSTANYIESLKNKGADITLTGALKNDSNELGYLYSNCKVFCLPSFYETPGISALEAGLCGANIVVTEIGGAQDYFEDYAYYVNPNSFKSVNDNLKRAWNRNWTEEESKKLASHIREKFSWSSVAKQTLDAYKSIL